jgi:hypothetical protein
VHRLRPKLLTEGVAIIGLVPMLWATGTGAEIMRPMAAPVLGGLLISDEVIDLMIPVLFYLVRKRMWLKLGRKAPNRGESCPQALAYNAVGIQHFNGGTTDGRESRQDGSLPLEIPGPGIDTRME